MYENEFEISELPRMARWAFWGIFISFGLKGVAGCLLMIAKAVDPAIVAKMGIWFGVLITLIWIPAAVGLGCGYLTIIRYPYLSQVIQVNESFISDPRSFLWRFLGMILVFVGVLNLTILFDPGSIEMAIGAVYVAITLVFGGLFLWKFDRVKHVTTATFLDVTFRVGFIMVPLYLPALLLGYLKNKRFAASIAKSEKSLPV